MSAAAAPRVIFISQWPKIRNAEYELIERVRQAGFSVAVTDFLGFEVDSGRCLNTADAATQFDCAVSLHYEAPKFLNLPTFLWVANPLEFMHAQTNYRTHLFHNIRSYDDYLYNGSDRLQEQIRLAVGDGWRDSGLSFFGACSRKAMLPPRTPDAPAAIDKVFYCGVNWERTTDRRGRAQGLLDLLQARDLAEFYGPRKLLHIDPWEGFSSYRGEIPFDGSSIFGAIHRYAAALAISSPAHLKSRTSSSRTIEAFAAGVPVISDDNPHVRTQFGDLPYFFGGDTEAERAESIAAAFAQIRSRPDEAAERVRAAQQRITDTYCYEATLEALVARVRGSTGALGLRDATAPAALRRIDVFAFHHDPYAPPGSTVDLPGAAHIAQAAAQAVRAGAEVRVHWLAASDAFVPPLPTAGVTWQALAGRVPVRARWDAMLLGEKLTCLAALAEGDIAVFHTDLDFPQHDALARALDWFNARPGDAAAAIHAGGFFVNDLAAPAPADTMGILRNTAPNSLYRWSQNSIAEHQFGQFAFSRAALAALDLDRLARFDVLLPVAVFLDAARTGVEVFRSRHPLLRVSQGHYHRYIDARARIDAGGFWTQQYELVSNRMHELNRLYDAFHAQSDAVTIIDRIIGYDLPASAVIDPAVHQVNQFIDLLRPWYRRWLAVRGFARRLVGRG